MSTSAGPLLRAECIRNAYGDVTALHDGNLELEAGTEPARRAVAAGIPLIGFNAYCPTNRYTPPTSARMMSRAGGL